MAYSLKTEDKFLLYLGVAIAILLFDWDQFFDKKNRSIQYQIENSCDSTGCIGDVKYSILKPGEFIKKYPGWVLLDGGSNLEASSLFQNSKLNKLFGIPSLPDARGIFLRGMNEGRLPDSGDVDGNRLVGRYQKDTFEYHVHNLMQGGADLSVGKPHGVFLFSYSKENPERTNPATPHLIADGASETRPRNIALYIYIKIN